MRRRIRSAAFPVHRHSLPQVALDAGLVALAYYLAYRLRFDGGIPDLYLDLFARTIGFVVIGSLACLAASGLYRHWMRYSSQREYVAHRPGRADRRRSRSSPTSRSCSRSCCSPAAASSRSSVPTGVLVLYGLLTLLFLVGARFAVHAVLRAPAARLPRPRATRARC